MSTLRRIVTGTDFTETSKGALREALRLTALDPLSKVTVLHVTDTPDERHPALLERLETFVLDLDQATPLPRERIDLRVQRGAVSSTIAEVAELTSADLIVVGPLQKGFVERVFTGGTAEQLFGKTHMPVLATRAPSEGGYNRILVPIDFSEESAEVLAFAATFGRLTSGGACLILLHAYAPPGGVHATGARNELLSRIKAETVSSMKAFAARCKATDAVTDYVAAPGVAQDVIPYQAELLGAELICMGSGGGGIGRHLMGSTTNAVLGVVTSIPMLVLWP